MRTLNYFLGLSALLPALGFAAPAPQPIEPPALEVRASASGCDPTFNSTVDFKFDFEELGPYCYYGPCLTTRHNVTSPRGQGFAYTRYGFTEKPLMLGNIHQWQVINCSWSEFAGKDESKACANNSAKALYSPGKSPYDAKVKPLLGSLDFAVDYLTWTVKSFHFTPVGLPAGTKEATLELRGVTMDGSEVKQSIKLQNTDKKKRFQITQLNRKGFNQLKVLELWLVAGGKGGYAFAIDDLFGTEFRYNPVPTSCKTPTTTIDHGPCTPAPTSTTTWTANGEEFPLSTYIPTPYKSLNWKTYISVLNNTSLANQYFHPKNVSPSRGKNFFQIYSPLTISANTYEARFGVKSLSVACSYWQWTTPDYSGTNGAPCQLIFIGRRDPFDGDGLPSRVVGYYSIPNPGNVTIQKFTDIDLTKITNDPGKFTRLYSFSVIAQIGIYNYSTNFLVDNVVFTRSIRKDEAKCRMPGSKTVNFDDISVGSSPVSLPGNYQGFKIEPPWAAISKKNYKKGTPGYIAPVSPNNAIWNGRPDTQGTYGGIDAFIDPRKNFLWTFESATITLDLPEFATNKSIIKDVQFSLNVMDACGYGSNSHYGNPGEKNPYFYSRSLTPTKLQFTFAEPIIAISKMSVSAYLSSAPDYREIKLFIDDLKYRKYGGKVPGCTRCGRRGGDWCEVPQIEER